MMLPYDQGPIDVNKILAYMAMEIGKDMVAAIGEKLKLKEGENSEKEVDGTIEINRLKLRKRLEKSLLVVLKVYPGLVDLLQEDKLRDRLLLHDTGAGLLFTSPSIRSYLPSVRISQISQVGRDVNSAFEVLRRGFLLGAYGNSLKSLFNTVKPHLDQDFAELIEFRFQELTNRMDRQRSQEFVNLQIPVLEYYPRLERIFRELAIVCTDSVNLALKFIRKLDDDRLKQFGEYILQVTQAANSSITTLKTLCDKYNLEESYRFNEASLKLNEIAKLVS